MTPRLALALTILLAGLAAWGQSSGVITSASVDDSHKVKCTDFCVESLTTDEKAALKAAREKVDAAQIELNAVEMKVRFAHGQSAGGTTLAMCYPYDSVELRGGYALIEYHFQSCTAW